MLKILGRNTSANVMKPVWLLAELGIPCDRQDIGGPFGGNDAPEFLALNPNGTVPVLVEGDFHMFESNAIVRHIAETRAGAPWWPADAHARAIANQWMDWASIELATPMVTLFIQHVRVAEPDRDAKAIAAALAKASKLWGILDAALAGRDFLLGDTLTVADIPAACWVQRWYALPVARPELPNLKAWFDRLGARPAYRKHVLLVG